jgi:hypothetical protein
MDSFSASSSEDSFSASSSEDSFSASSSEDSFSESESSVDSSLLLELVGDAMAYDEFSTEDCREYNARLYVQFFRHEDQLRNELANLTKYSVHTIIVLVNRLIDGYRINPTICRPIAHAVVQIIGQYPAHVSSIGHNKFYALAAVTAPPSLDSELLHHIGVDNDPIGQRIVDNMDDESKLRHIELLPRSVVDNWVLPISPNTLLDLSDFDLLPYILWLYPTINFDWRTLFVVAHYTKSSAWLVYCSVNGSTANYNYGEFCARVLRNSMSRAVVMARRNADLPFHFFDGAVPEKLIDETIIRRVLGLVDNSSERRRVCERALVRMIYAQRNVRLAKIFLMDIQYLAHEFNGKGLSLYFLDSELRNYASSTGRILWGGIPYAYHTATEDTIGAIDMYNQLNDNRFRMTFSEIAHVVFGIDPIESPGVFMFHGDIFLPVSPPVSQLNERVWNRVFDAMEGVSPRQWETDFTRLVTMYAENGIIYMAHFLLSHPRCPKTFQFLSKDALYDLL